MSVNLSQVFFQLGADLNQVFPQLGANLNKAGHDVGFMNSWSFGPLGLLGLVETILEVLVTFLNFEVHATRIKC